MSSNASQFISNPISSHCLISNPKPKTCRLEKCVSLSEHAFVLNSGSIHKLPSPFLFPSGFSQQNRSIVTASHSQKLSIDSVLELSSPEKQTVTEKASISDCFDSTSNDNFLSYVITPSDPNPVELRESLSENVSSPTSNAHEIGKVDLFNHPRFSVGKNLSDFCSFGIGGPAKFFIEVRNEKDLLLALNYCKLNRIKYIIIGKGSNCLFDDRGYNGMVILNRINFFTEISHGKFYVGSGFPFNVLGIACSKKNYAGLEFASGIPGTVGGAVFMNAGANGQETGDVLASVDIINSNLEKISLHKSKGELEYSYRKSVFQNMDECVILSATFQLSDCDQARNRQMSYLERRKKSQPIADRSAGCVFRNPKNFTASAGAIIENLGMKKFSIGGASVSEIHANFLVNSGNSKCSDMLTLIREIKAKAFKEYGVELNEEIRYIPYDGLL